MCTMKGLARMVVLCQMGGLPRHSETNPVIPPNVNGAVEVGVHSPPHAEQGRRTGSDKSHHHSSPKKEEKCC